MTVNVIIKYFAGDSLAKKSLEPIIYGDTTGYVNIVVISEVIFILFKLFMGKKAYELKDSPETVKNVFKSLNTQIQFLGEYFSELEINESVKQKR